MKVTLTHTMSLALLIALSACGGGESGSTNMNGGSDGSEGSDNQYRVLPVPGLDDKQYDKYYTGSMILEQWVDFDRLDIHASFDSSDGAPVLYSMEPDECFVLKHLTAAVFMDATGRV